MRYGWIYIYESPPASKRFEDLADHFALAGITLAEPESGRVIKLSPIGEQITSSRQDILNDCAALSDVNFNFYLGPSDNLFCSIYTLRGGVVREGYSLDGKTDEGSDRVIKVLTDLFKRRAENKEAFGFVVDKYAELRADFHWDDFFLGDVTSPPEWPMVLGVSNDFPKLNLVPSGQYVQESTSGYTLFRAGRVAQP